MSRKKLLGIIYAVCTRSQSYTPQNMCSADLTAYSLSREMIEIIRGMPDNVVAVIAHGKVTGEDYHTVFISAIEEKLRTHKKIRLLYCLGKDFSGYTVVAILDDAKVSVQHLTAFEKMAVVTDVHWITEAAKFFGVFIPCPVKIYANERLSEAKTWITE
jgi:hypothetical protein